LRKRHSVPGLDICLLLARAALAGFGEISILLA
jgi:hypothetical protein